MFVNTAGSQYIHTQTVMFFAYHIQKRVLRNTTYCIMWTHVFYCKKREIKSILNEQYIYMPKPLYRGALIYAK